ncbi:hypothetical protein N9149_03025 [Akkermansiaceae bacterium]|nr:hypothetical protein [Akkermansiaceae bacterium]
MVETHSNGAAFECVTGHQWADRLIELGRQLLRARQSSDQQQLRIALIQPTLAFSETFVAMGYLLQKYLSEEHCLKSTARDTKWDEKLNERFGWMYRDPGTNGRTCLRNGRLTEDPDSETGFGLLLEGGNNCYTKQLSWEDAARLTAPLEAHWTTSAHANSRCSHSIDFLTRILGSEHHALNFSRQEEPSLRIDGSSRTRLRNEATNNLEFYGHRLRLEDVVRSGHQDESLPQNVFWKETEGRKPELTQIFSGSNAVLDNSRAKYTAPVLYILSRDDAELPECLDSLEAKYTHPNSKSLSAQFRSLLALEENPSIELLAWL